MTRLCLVLVAASLATPCGAQGTYEVTPLVGLHVALGQAPLVLGAHVTGWTSDQGGFDIALSHWPSRAYGVSANTTSGSVAYMLAVPSHDSLSVFAVGGLAFIALHNTCGNLIGTCNAVSSTPSQTDWGPLLGLGFRMPFSRALALRVEAEDQIYWVDDWVSNAQIQHALIVSAGLTVILPRHSQDTSTASGMLPPNLPAPASLTVCGNIVSAESRLACYDSVAKAVAAPPLTPILNPGSWQVSEERNPLDDSKTVILTLIATNGASIYGRSVGLILRCESHQTEVSITWGGYLGEEANVTFRVGDAEARTLDWRLSTDKTAAFYPGSAVEFIQTLISAEFVKGAGAGRFVAQVTPYKGIPITATFDVRGLEFALRPLRSACGW